MKVYVGNLTFWQKSKMLTALYDNIAVAKRYSPLDITIAKDLLHERKNQIRYVGSIFIGVNFDAKDGYVDLEKYNEYLHKEGINNARQGEVVVRQHLDDIGLASIAANGVSKASLANACDATAKPFIVHALPKGKIIERCAVVQTQHEKDRAKIFDAKYKSSVGC